jgi:MFS family permease
MIARLRANVGLIILFGCLISLITLGVRAGFGLFTDPLTEARGWDREVFALAMALQNLLWGLGQPIAGAIADRFGPGRVLTAGAALYAAGTALMAVSTSPIALHVSGGVLLGLGLAGSSFTVVIAAFSRLVPPDRRTAAIGLATAMGSLGPFLFAPIGQGCIYLRPDGRVYSAA